MTERRLARALAVLAVAALAALAPSARAEVVDVAANGFSVRTTVTVPVDAAKAYAEVVEDVGKWWDPEHTFSGDARNLSIDARPQGCFCERLPERGGVRHLSVAYAAPGKLLRLEGGLGPLQAMGLAGSMTWKFSAADKGTSVELRYVVGGYNPGGFGDLAGGVDAVLRSQLERYRRYVETGKP